MEFFFTVFIDILMFIVLHGWVFVSELLPKNELIFFTLCFFCVCVQTVVLNGKWSQIFLIAWNTVLIW